MNCVILQPSYIPWRGFFHQIQKADVFVFYDDVQYDAVGWRNRNKIKTAAGLKWLSIPVRHRGTRAAGTPICQIPICWDTNWSRKHFQTLCHAYSKAPFFDNYRSALEQMYSASPELLADFTIHSTIQLASWLGITAAQFLRSSEMKVSGTKTRRLLEVLQHVGATHYITGPSARDYLDEQLLRESGISVEYMSYDYPEYPQLHPPFEPQVSVLDLLFMTGESAGRYIWGGSDSGTTGADS